MFYKKLPKYCYIGLTNEIGWNTDGTDYTDFQSEQKNLSADWKKAGFTRIFAFASQNGLKYSINQNIWENYYAKKPYRKLLRKRESRKTDVPKLKLFSLDS